MLCLASHSHFFLWMQTKKDKTKTSAFIDWLFTFLHVRVGLMKWCVWPLEASLHLFPCFGFCCSFKLCNRIMCILLCDRMEGMVMTLALTLLAGRKIHSSLVTMRCLSATLLREELQKANSGVLQTCMHMLCVCVCVLVLVYMHAVI